MQQNREGMQESAMASGAGMMAGGGLIGLVAGVFLGLALAKSNQTHEHG
jgi:hypothetical protein